MAPVVGTDLVLDHTALKNLNEGIESVLQGGERVVQRERAAGRIQRIMKGIARKVVKLEGQVSMFGSFLNGFKTSGSDLDIVFLSSVNQNEIIQHLGSFAEAVPDFGFVNVTRIFSANVPLVKFSDRKSGMEVDFCIDNELGVRNSMLLNKYCECDPRVMKLGRLVKDWAKRQELVGVADGCLNSYAYMLLVIHFLQGLDDPVVPNLQLLAEESKWIIDRKWGGGEDSWDTKFLEDVSTLPPSKNTMSLGELLIRFFHYFVNVFDWHQHAVCMRLNKPGHTVDKYTLSTPTNDEQWYVEDPFDLKHNLGGKCTRTGRQRILDAMRVALDALTSTGDWKEACPAQKHDAYFLKCRLSPGVTPHALLEQFECFNLVRLHFSKADSSGRMGQAFLEFDSAETRRKAHTKNETYVVDCQLQLHYSSQYSLIEAVDQSSGNYTSFDVASYRMQRQALAERYAPLDQSSRPPAKHQGSSRQPSVQQQQQQQQQQDVMSSDMVPMQGIPMHGYNAWFVNQQPMYPIRRGQTPKQIQQAPQQPYPSGRPVVQALAPAISNGDATSKGREQKPAAPPSSEGLGGWESTVPCGTLSLTSTAPAAAEAVARANDGAEHADGDLHGQALEARTAALAPEAPGRRSAWLSMNLELEAGAAPGSILSEEDAQLLQRLLPLFQHYAFDEEAQQAKPHVRIEANFINVGERPRSLLDAEENQTIRNFLEG